jgi:hypothetical protein
VGVLIVCGTTLKPKGCGVVFPHIIMIYYVLLKIVRKGEADSLDLAI